MERTVREVRAVIAVARGELDRALDESADALRMGRDARDPQALVPSLVSRSFVLALVGREQESAAVLDEALEEGLRELLHLLECGVALVWLGERFGRVADVRSAAAQAPLRSSWVEVAERYLDGDLTAAAERYDEIGARSDAAWARLAAAERLLDEGRRAEAEPQLAQALAFYRSVEATGHVRRAEALLRESA
jgi:tetratricopeptide (TPR) repeat protein